jgi:hypothetical protein
MMPLFVGWLPFVPRKSRDTLRSILLNEDDVQGSGALIN